MLHDLVVADMLQRSVCSCSRKEINLFRSDRLVVIKYVIMSVNQREAQMASPVVLSTARVR